MVSPEIWLITAEPTGWQLYKEPEPQYKVGDWVEVSGRGRTIHGKCISTEGTVSEPNNMIRACGYLFNPDGTDARYRCKTHGYIITRKLSPSEVIVNIGRLSGTVEPVSNNGIHLWFHLVGINRKTIATISIESLDTNTRELVESLLEAMQEG